MFERSLDGDALGQISGLSADLECTRDPKRAVMVEDLPKNLLPAHRMGMTTVLVRTHEEWAQAGADGEHVHHVTDDLVAWLEAAGK